MSYTFKEMWLDKSRYALKSPYAMTATSITVHNTANDAPAINEIRNLIKKENTSSTSFHVAIDDKEVIQAIPFNRNAFAAGDGGNGKGNRTSIHLEICFSKSGSARYTAAEENAVQYIAKLLKEFGWGIDRVKQHWDWPRADGYRKNCPHRIRDEKRWDSFLNRIKAAMSDGKLRADNGALIEFHETEDATVWRVQSGGYKTRAAAIAAAKKSGFAFNTIVGTREG